MSGNNENLWSSSLTGSVLGLNVVLNIEQLQYLGSGLTASAGARVTIHDTMVRPLVDEYGMDVEPHKATSFAIEKVGRIKPVRCDGVVPDLLRPAAGSLGHGVLQLLVRHQLLLLHLRLCLTLSV